MPLHFPCLPCIPWFNISSRSRANRSVGATHDGPAGIDPLGWNGRSSTRFEEVNIAVITRSILLAVAASLAASADAAAAEPVNFNRDVRPILSDKCFHCHGPDPETREAGLRLDVRDEAMQELDSGSVAIVPGKPDASELITRVAVGDDDAAMPPPHAKLGRLSAKEIDTLRRWIAEECRSPSPTAGRASRAEEASQRRHRQLRRE